MKENEENQEERREPKEAKRTEQHWYFLKLHHPTWLLALVRFFLFL